VLHAVEEYLGACKGLRTVTPQARFPTLERNPAWRAACLAYREKPRLGFDHEAPCAAVAALQAVWPMALDWKRVM
jgi:hypothetical protein